MFRLPVPDEGMDRHRLRTALAVANVPTLLMVLYHLEGDERWLAAPYRPARNPGQADHNDGGLPADIQQEIRDAAFDAIACWSDGVPAAIGRPPAERLRRMLAVLVGDDVPDTWGLLLEEVIAETPGSPVISEPDTACGLSALVIGAGFSGLTVATKLREAGIEVAIVEKNPDVGGTWFENRYPGAGVDTPSYLYSLSFFQQQWSMHFAKQDEVLNYLRALADDRDLRRLITFSAEVTHAEFIDDEQQWRVTVQHADGRVETRMANIVVTAVGLLSRPRESLLPGVTSFRGRIFHSARWPDDVDLRSKRVAVVGTGASAMQIVPAIAATVEHLVVVQRSPQWAAPNENVHRAVDDDLQWLVAHVPFYYVWYRARLFFLFSDRVHPSLQLDPSWTSPERSMNALNDGHRRFFTRYVETKLAGHHDLIDRSLPSYPPFGKRMLLDHGWYDAITRPNVELVAGMVETVTESGLLLSDGSELNADVIIMCTGFDAQRPLFPMDVRGRSGRSVREAWGDDDARAYLGITAPDFPNLFFMYGPNTNPGGGAITFISECQARYITQIVTTMARDGIAVIECRDEVNDAYNVGMDQANLGTVWNHPGMDTYYRNSKGRIVTNMPWRIVDYWALTRTADLAAFRTEAVR